MSPSSAATTPATERQILVVGDGVDGLATAAFLRQEGLAPVVVTAGDASTRTDEACDPASTSPVLLWRPALSLLSELGIADALRSSGESIRRWQLHHGTGETTDRLASAGDGDSVVAVGRDQLRTRLREALSPAQVRLSKTPRRLVPTDHGLRVDFADGVREQFDAIVGADGAHSWVRDAQTGTETPMPWGTTEWPVSMDALATAETVVDAWGPGAMLTAFPTGRGLLVTSTTAARAAATRLDSLLDRVDVTDGSNATLGTPTAPYGLSADQWTGDRVGFVGAAARSLPPTLTLAPSLAVEAAAVLAAELATSVPVVEALDRYARRRRGRLRTLDRQVSLRRQPSRMGDTDPVEAAHALRTAVLRSFFADPSADLSAPPADPR